MTSYIHTLYFMCKKEVGRLRTSSSSSYMTQIHCIPEFTTLMGYSTVLYARRTLLGQIFRTSCTLYVLLYYVVVRSHQRRANSGTVLQYQTEHSSDRSLKCPPSTILKYAAICLHIILIVNIPFQCDSEIFHDLMIAVYMQ